MLKPEKGFTLIEVLLALLILAGAGFFLLLKIPVDIQEENLALSSQRMKYELREIQQAAITNNKWYRVKFYPDARYMIFEEGTYQKTIELAQGVTFGNSPPNLLFLPTGAPSQGMTIILKAGIKERRIIIAPVMGRIREQVNK